MPRIDRFLTATEARSRLPELVRNLNSRHEILAITQEGAPTAVLMSMKHFEGLIETIEILGDPAATRSIRKSLRQARAGKWVGHKAVFGQKPK